MEEYIPAINVSETRMTQFQLETLYKIMLKRIGKGYTAEELSFLIGRDPNFIDGAEKWFRHFYTQADLKNIAAALQENSVADIVAVADNEELIPVKVKWYHNLVIDFIIYSYFTERHDECQLFTLKEDISASYALSNENIDGFHSLSRLIRTLVDADYFVEKRNPLEIYLAVKPLMTFAHLRPNILYDVLIDLCKGEMGDELLEKVPYEGYNYGFIATPREDED